MKTTLFDPPQSGCVLTLPGLPGGGAFLLDRSPYGNHGVNTGAAWFKTPGGIWCLHFDGVDDYVRIPATAELDIIAGDITIALWFRATQIDRTCDLFQKGTGSGSYAVYLNSANHLFFIKQGDGSSVVASNTAIEEGRWYFLTVTRQARIGRLFLNGVVDGIDTDFADFISKDDLFIGKGDDGNFAGQITLLSIYHRALSSLEIHDRFQNEKHYFGVW